MTEKKTPKWMRIENLTAANIDLPPIPATATSDAFPVFPLIPGLNNVPFAYFVALESYEVQNVFGVATKPHAKLLDKLKKPVRKWPAAPEGRIRVHGATDQWIQPGVAVGSLDDLSEAAAIDAVLAEKDPTKLADWMQTEHRAAVKEALAARYAKIS